MGLLTQLYGTPLGLLTDLYEVTMAYAWWKSGRADREATFHLSFRAHPFGGGYTVCAGLEQVLELLDGFRFAPGDLDYLAGLRGNDGAALFERAFLDYLGGLRPEVDVDAMPEGTVAFPHEPLVRVCGPIVPAQLLETALLNLVNFPTLVATKAARIVGAARGAPVVEFGLRRAQGPDGGVTASRAAWVGGCSGTSNLLAGRLLGIPVKGTHAHSWVMFFDSEDEAFAEYADALPNNCIFLVDTYDTLAGVRRAVEIGRRLRERGHEMLGIRLDSGDLAWLSTEARRILDDGGFPDARILASNNLDEHVITSLREQGAKIDVWGVGTRLVTGHGDPALGGVYKLSAVRDPGGPWRPRLKLSEQKAKISNPGVLQVRRYRAGGEFVGDVIWDETLGIDGTPTIVDPLDATRRKVLPADTPHDDLLVPVLRAGRRVYEPPPLPEVRERTLAQLAAFHAGIKRFVHPHQYPVGLEPKLHELKRRLTVEAREGIERWKAR